jgi:hypothetical protein
VFLAICVLEHDDLIGCLPREVVPPLERAVVHLSVLEYLVAVDDIAGHSVGCEVDSSRIADGKGPVNKRSLKRMPSTRSIVSSSRGRLGACLSHALDELPLSFEDKVCLFAVGLTDDGYCTVIGMV